MSRREPDVLLEDILMCAKNLREYVFGMDFEDFVKDNKTKDAIIRNLEVIGEAVSKLPDSFKEEYPNIPWRRIIAMRNRIIHEYFGLKVDVIWRVATEDIDELCEALQEILEKIDSQHGNS